MSSTNRSGSRFLYQLSLGGLLITATFISLVLARVHSRIDGTQNYSFLVFNLWLAWIPLVAAGIAYLTLRSRVLFYLVMPFSTLIWLIFFPNASYLLTDFQHLAYPGGGSPLWFDVLLMVWFAWTGLLLGITSLYLMQDIVTRKWGATLGWAFAIGATILSSIGVYLGRFLRWNSWDILQDPLPIARDMVGIVRHPITNFSTYVFTSLFTLLFLFIYLTIHLFGRIMRERSAKMVASEQKV